jgi:alkaline phosphatase
MAQVIMGGGLSNFLPKAEYEKSDRKDGLNLVNAWIREREGRQQKYSVALKGSQLGEALASKPDYLLGEFRPGIF